MTTSTTATVGRQKENAIQIRNTCTPIANSRAVYALKQNCRLPQSSQTTTPTAQNKEQVYKPALERT